MSQEVVRETFQVRIPVPREAYEDMGHEVWLTYSMGLVLDELKQLGTNWNPIRVVRREDYSWHDDGEDAGFVPVGFDSIYAFGGLGDATQYVFVYEAEGVPNG